MRSLFPLVLCAGLVSCEKSTDGVARRIAQLEQRAEAAEARSEELEQLAAEREIVREREAIERERLSLEEERYQLIRMDDEAKAAAERELLEREQGLVARELRAEDMQDQIDRNLDQIDDLSAELDERERELAGREALATVREEDSAGPVNDYNVFYNSLSPYGSWFETADYGYVWQPAVVREVSWRPYTRGRWVCTDYGWTWISDEPFGWATYHYGRWALIAGRGWIWVPGRDWAPAWVCWRYGSSHIGWAPLPPESLAYRHGTWGTDIETTFGIGASWFCFVETRNFCAPIRRHCLPYGRNPYFWGHTRNVTRIHSVDGRTICGGPSYGAVARQIGRPVPFYRLEMDRRGRVTDRHPRVSDGRLRVHAPNVDKGWHAGARPPKVRERWDQVAIQRERPPAAEVREKFRETRIQERPRADRETPRLGTAQPFPAPRREEAATVRKPVEKPRRENLAETRRPELPARQTAREERLREARRQQSEIAAREIARRQQEARQRELNQRTQEQTRRADAARDRHVASPGRTDVVPRPSAIQRAPQAQVVRRPQAQVTPQVTPQRQEPTRVRSAPEPQRVQRQEARRPQASRPQRVEQSRSTERSGRPQRNR